MLTYEVTLEVMTAPTTSVERYMVDKHIPEIFSTGCFQAIVFETSEDGRFRTRYSAASEEDLNRYIRDHAPHFREDFLANFPSGVIVTRQIWRALASW